MDLVAKSSVGNFFFVDHLQNRFVFSFKGVKFIPPKNGSTFFFAATGPPFQVKNPQGVTVRLDGDLGSWESKEDGPLVGYRGLYGC